MEDPCEFREILPDGPLRLCGSLIEPSRGRFMVANKNIIAGEAVLTRAPVLSAILPSWKKRVCSQCYCMSAKRLQLSCDACGEVWYCSAACKAQHMEGQPLVPSCDEGYDGQVDGDTSEADLGRPPGIPHRLECRMLQLLGACKCSADDHCILRMLLSALALQLQEQTPRRPQLPSAGKSPFSWAARLQELGSHAQDFDDDSRQDWCKNLTFFQKGLARAGWAGKTPHLQELLHLVGVVVTNSFGIYSNNCPQASTPHTVPSSSVSSDCSAGALQSSENGLEGEAAPDLPEAEPVNAGQRGEDLIGRELYLDISFFNHSCEPTCAFRRRPRRMAVIEALQDLQVGEEATICYIDSNLPRSARREVLLRQFYFECHCPRCERELVDGSDKIRYMRSISVHGSTGPKRRGRKARTHRV